MHHISQLCILEDVLENASSKSLWILLVVPFLCLHPLSAFGSRPSTISLVESTAHRDTIGLLVFISGALLWVGFFAWQFSAVVMKLSYSAPIFSALHGEEIESCRCWLDASFCSMLPLCISSNSTKFHSSRAVLLNSGRPVMAVSWISAGWDPLSAHSRIFLNPKCLASMAPHRSVDTP